MIGIHKCGGNSGATNLVCGRSWFSPFYLAPTRLLLRLSLDSAILVLSLPRSVLCIPLFSFQFLYYFSFMITVWNPFSFWFSFSAKPLFCPLVCLQLWIKLCYTTTIQQGYCRLFEENKNSWFKIDYYYYFYFF